MQTKLKQNKLPIQMKLAKTFGVQELLLRNFVFVRKQSKYMIKKINGKNILIMNQQIYQPPKQYDFQTLILQNKNQSVPIFHFIPKNVNPNSLHLTSIYSNKRPAIKHELYIIYSHGNSSDLSDAVKFLHQLCILFSEVSKQKNSQTYLFFGKYLIHLIAFDYTGYGQSGMKKSETTEKTICTDLEMVISWVNLTKKISFNQIILWGFSLGTYPVSYCSAVYPVLGCILQSPVASISCFLNDLKQKDDIQAENLNNSTINDIEEDYLSNLKFVGKINCDILIMHSIQDDIIPFNHSKILIQRYYAQSLRQSLQFLEISRLKHNQMHKYICSLQSNPLRNKFLKFIERIVLDPSNNICSSINSPISQKCSCKITSEHYWDKFQSSGKINNEACLSCSSKIDPLQSILNKKTKNSKQNKYMKYQKDHEKRVNKLYEQFEQATINEQTQIQFEYQIEGGIKRQRIKNSKKKVGMMNCYCFQNC